MPGLLSSLSCSTPPALWSGPRLATVQPADWRIGFSRLSTSTRQSLFALAGAAAGWLNGKAPGPHCQLPVGDTCIFQPAGRRSALLLLAPLALPRGTHGL